MRQPALQWHSVDRPWWHCISVTMSVSVVTQAVVTAIEHVNCVSRSEAERLFTVGVQYTEAERLVRESTVCREQRLLLNNIGVIFTVRRLSSYWDKCNMVNGCCVWNSHWEICLMLCYRWVTYIAYFAYVFVQLFKRHERDVEPHSSDSAQNVWWYVEVWLHLSVTV